MQIACFSHNGIYNRENCVRPFLVHKFWVPDPPPSPSAQKTPCLCVVRTGYEFATRLQDIITNFNINTNAWMKIYVMKRLRFLGNKELSQLGALLFLALWHGMYFGYFAAFIMEFLDMMIEVWRAPARRSPARAEGPASCRSLVRRRVEPQDCPTCCRAPDPTQLKAGGAIRTLTLFFFLLWHPLSDVWWLLTNRHRLPTNRHRLPTNRHRLPTDRHRLPTNCQRLPTGRHHRAYWTLRVFFFHYGTP